MPSLKNNRNKIELSIILPCHNEAEALPSVLPKILGTLKNISLRSEIILVDNASADSSAKIAEGFGVRVIIEPRLGYGFSCQAGLNHAKGKYLIMGDPDGTYDFTEIPRLLKLLETNDLVVGSRYLGQIKKGSMPWSHRYLGNPVIRFLLHRNSLRLRETSTGLIGLKSRVLPIINASSGGMEFSSEFLVKAAKNKIKIIEHPINYSQRIGASKIREIRDGLRHATVLIKLMFS